MKKNIIMQMELRKKGYFPPIHKNYYRGDNFPENKHKKILKSTVGRSINNIVFSPKMTKKVRDLSVSPRYLKFHEELVHRSRIALQGNFEDLITPHKTPIHLVKMYDFELERWREKVK